MRAGTLVGSGFLRPWKGRIAGVPLTTEEVKEHIQIRYETDELEAIRMLTKCDSVSGEIYLRLRLTRSAILEALKELADDRAAQVVLCSVVCATRFEYYGAGQLLQTECARCGEIDSLEHLLRCTGMGPIPSPEEDPEPTIQYLVEMARRARDINAGPPIPKRVTLSEDLSLNMETPSEEEVLPEAGAVTLETRREELLPEETETPKDAELLAEGTKKED